MRVIDSNLELLEQKLIILLNKLKDNHLVISRLEGQVLECKNQIHSLESKVEQLKIDNNALQVANSLLGSNESKATTKRKLSALINEVDACIQHIESLE
jgi:chromosome segregation ATPase